jgi:hypothetical protein
MTTFLAEATEWTVEQVATVITEQLAEPYGLADNLRTAAMYCPRKMPSSDFVAAAVECGVHPSTARCRFNETRRWMEEMGE